MSEKRSWMPRLLDGAIVAAVAAAVLVWPLCWGLGATARTVLFVLPWDEAAVTANRFEFQDDHPDASKASDADVVAIYGTLSAHEGEEAEVVLPDEARIVRPAERPALTLYARGDGWIPTMAFVRYVTRATSIGAAAAAFALVLLRQFLRRRRAARGDPPSD